jgi:hypothetical protein
MHVTGIGSSHHFLPIAFLLMSKPRADGATRL